jgi:hypothetical protein
MDAAAPARKRKLQGRLPACERTSGAQTTVLFFVFAKASPDGYQTRRSLLAKADGAYGKTAWSWHPLLMLNLRRFCSAQPGKANPFPLTTVAR